MDPFECCPICGLLLEDNGGNDHHCSEKFLAARERGLKTDNELGRVRTPPFSERLKDGATMLREGGDRD